MQMVDVIQYDDGSNVFSDQMAFEDAVAHIGTRTGGNAAAEAARRELELHGYCEAYRQTSYGTPRRIVARLVKLASEPMIEGGLDINWANRDNVAETRKYMIFFHPYRGFVGGSQPHRDFVGEAALVNYLTQFGADPEEVRQRLLQLHSQGHIAWDNWMMPEEEAKFYSAARFAAQG